MAEHELQTLTNHDFGYTIDVPVGWRDVGPDIYNSVFEVARYLRHAPRIHDGIVNLFWGIPGESPRAAAENGDPAVFDLNRACLEREGVTEIAVSDTTLAGRPATRLDHAYRLGDIEHWASRSYFLTVRGTLICLNLGTSDVESDRELYDRIAKSFDVIENAVGIVLIRDEATPTAFVTDILEDTFDYRRERAMQRLVRMNAQRESVVALVDEARAPEIVAAVTARSRAAGHGLTCRIAGHPE